MEIKKDNDFLWRQFIKLGDMIGDGLHWEEPWISKEYKKLAKILIPPDEEQKAIMAENRRRKNKNIDNQVKVRLEKDKCTCGSELRQSRSGSVVVKCTSQECGKKFKYGKKR